MKQSKFYKQQLIKEASIPSWDGYGALPVSKLNDYKAKQFLRALPSVPSPEIGIDPDGEISFEWYGNGDDPNVFTVSISETGKLTYAGIFNKRRVSGVEYLDDGFPRILEYIKQFINSADYQLLRRKHVNAPIQEYDEKLVTELVHWSALLTDEEFDYQNVASDEYYKSLRVISIKRSKMRK